MNNTFFLVAQKYASVNGKNCKARKGKKKFKMENDEKMQDVDQFVYSKKRAKRYMIRQKRLEKDARHKMRLARI